MEDAEKLLQNLMFTVIMSALMSINATLAKAGDDINDAGERINGEKKQVTKVSFIQPPIIIFITKCPPF